MTGRANILLPLPLLYLFPPSTPLLVDFYCFVAINCLAVYVIVPHPTAIPVLGVGEPRVHGAVADADNTHAKTPTHELLWKGVGIGIRLAEGVLP